MKAFLFILVGVIFTFSSALADVYRCEPFLGQNGSPLHPGTEYMLYVQSAGVWLRVDQAETPSRPASTVNSPMRFLRSQGGSSFYEAKLVNAAIHTRQYGAHLSRTVRIQKDGVESNCHITYAPTPSYNRTITAILRQDTFPEEYSSKLTWEPIPLLRQHYRVTGKREDLISFSRDNRFIVLQDAEHQLLSD
jgi:hypothetical protein